MDIDSRQLAVNRTVGLSWLRPVPSVAACSALFLRSRTRTAGERNT